MAQTNPDWTRDEHILALDLYFRRGVLSKHHPEVIELSRLLNHLPIHDPRGVGSDFRNPNGVYMKLNNFRRWDPDYPGVGLQNGSRQEGVVWNEFVNDQHRLRTIASGIRGAAEDEGTREAVEGYPEEEEETAAEEGRVLYRLHRIRERDRKITEKKKSSVLKAEGALRCEACRFDFHETYGTLGEGYIECHHSAPVSTLLPGQKTRLQDLVLLCSNCHRMVHRRGLRTVTELRGIIEGHRERRTSALPHETPGAR